MRERCLQGFVPADSKVGGVSGGEMPSQSKNPGKIEGVFHVWTLEVEGDHLAGGVITVAVV